MALTIFCALVWINSRAQENILTAKPDTMALLVKALEGDVPQVLGALDTLDAKTLSPQEQAFKQKYFDRFKNHERPALKTSDTTLLAVFDIYYRYWDDVLLKQKTIEAADDWLKNTLGKYIWDVHYRQQDVERDTIIEKFDEYTQKMFASKGIKTNNGKVQHIHDFIVWMREDTVIYDVELPETRVNVKIIFMGEVIGMGWEEYATFGVFFPGGWATTTQLNCVEYAYDKNSESFTVSYLKHEGQHFADYIIFPMLSGADLEYRAKLTELCYANENLYKLIKFFVIHANRNRNDSHAFANSCVARDMSKIIFKKDLETDMEKWKKVSPKKIHKTALKLLKKNTADLKKKGREVKTFIQ